jgi:hypothetical protein
MVGSVLNFPSGYTQRHSALTGEIPSVCGSYFFLRPDFGPAVVDAAGPFLGGGVIDASAQLLGGVAIYNVWGNLPLGQVPAAIACKIAQVAIITSTIQAY